MRHYINDLRSRKFALGLFFIGGIVLAAPFAYNVNAGLINIERSEYTSPYAVTAEGSNGILLKVRGHLVPPPQPVYSISYLMDLVKNLGLSKGLENSLLAKLEAAEKSDNKGRVNAAEGQLGAFMNQVKALVGNAISVSQSDELTSVAGYLIDNL